jgi:hypothetical protein
MNKFKDLRINLCWDLPCILTCDTWTRKREQNDDHYDDDDDETPQ